MINLFKFTNFKTQKQVSGVLPNDSNIEFVGVPETKKVLWLQHGSTRYFKDLPLIFFNIVKDAYLGDSIAFRFLGSATKCIKRQVELYAYYNHGDLDTTPDIKNGKLSPSENFRHSQDCPSLLWETKNINIGNHVLTPKQLIIIDLLNEDLPDKAIADYLGLKSQSTLDFHKSKLFKAVGVTNKTALLKLCLQHKIIK